jgi:hypothetical protein
MIQKILFLTRLTVMMRGLQEMTAGMIMLSDNQDSLDPHFFAGFMTVLNATMTQKSSPVAVAGPTQFIKEMFAPPSPQAGPAGRAEDADDAHAG